VLYGKFATDLKLRQNYEGSILDEFGSILYGVCVTENFYLHQTSEILYCVLLAWVCFFLLKDVGHQGRSTCFNQTTQKWVIYKRNWGKVNKIKI